MTRGRLTKLGMVQGPKILNICLYTLTCTNNARKCSNKALISAVVYHAQFLEAKMVVPLSHAYQPHQSGQVGTSLGSTMDAFQKAWGLIAVRAGALTASNGEQKASTGVALVDVLQGRYHKECLNCSLRSGAPLYTLPESSDIIWYLRKYQATTHGLSGSILLQACIASDNIARQADASMPLKWP